MSTDDPIDGGAAYDRWADYYDIGEGDRQPYLDFYASLLRADTRSVLEIACGTGVIASELRRRIADRGLEPRVAGIDLSMRMLDIARARDRSVDWVHADMRELPIEGRFDLVFCCFNSFQFMLEDADLQAAFAAARDRTAPGGRFALDLYQPNLPYLAVARQDSLARSLQHQGRALQIREDARYDPERRLLDLEWRLVEADDASVELARTRFRIRQYLASDIERLLAATGWRILESFGDLQRAPFGANSKKQVLVCAPA